VAGFPQLNTSPCAAGWQLVPVLAGWLQVPDEIHSQLAAVWVQGLEDFGTCDNDIAVIFTMLDADGDGQISKQEFVEGYHKLALLPPVSRAPISSAPVDDQTANGQHNTLSHCDDLGSPKTESIYHQISLTQNPFLRQTQQQLISILAHPDQGACPAPELLRKQWQLFLELPDAQLPCDAQLERLKALVKSDRALVLQAITGAPLSHPIDHAASADVQDLLRGMTLYKLAEQGRSDVITQMLGESTFGLGYTNSLGSSLLFCAATHGKESVVNVLGKMDAADLDQINLEGSTPLLAAAQNGHEAVVSALVALKADVHKSCRKYLAGATPLFVASQEGFANVVQLLVDGRADPNKGTHRRESPVMVAACQGHEAAVRVLATSKADLNAVSKNGLSTLFCARAKGYQSIVDVLLEFGAHRN